MRTLVLEIPDDLQDQLLQGANDKGVPLHAFATDLLQRYSPPKKLVLDKSRPSEETPESLFDFLGDLVGCVGEGDAPRDFSERHSELFTDYLEEKRKDGRLEFLNPSLGRAIANCLISRIRWSGSFMKFNAVKKNGQFVFSGLG